MAGPARALQSQPFGNEVPRIVRPNHFGIVATQCARCDPGGLPEAGRGRFLPLLRCVWWNRMSELAVIRGARPQCPMVYRRHLFPDRLSACLQIGTLPIYETVTVPGTQAMIDPSASSAGVATVLPRGYAGVVPMGSAPHGNHTVVTPGNHRSLAVWIRWE